MFLPYGKQTIDDDDIASVVSVLKSDFLTCGPEVNAFEQEFAAMVGAKYAVAVCNATAALHLALLVAGITKGDRVVTSPNTFLSSANCAAFIGAIPDFADIDPATYNLCPRSLEQNWQEDTKAVVAVAYAGQPADMPAIAEIARKRGAIVIEDGCHGPGGGFVYEGKFYKIGAHPWADITTFSFHPVKTITTGEGGMLVTDNEDYAQHARLLRSHGVVREPSQFKTFSKNEGTSASKKNPASTLLEIGPWVYEMQELGYNYRITDIQCALGRNQLKKLPEFIKRRQEIVDHYNTAFADLPWLKTPKDSGWLVADDDSSHPVICYSPSEIAGTMHPVISYHLYTVQIDFEALGKSRSQVMAELRDQGVGTQVLYIPVYLQSWYQQTYSYKVGKCSNAEAYYTKALSLPLFPVMLDEEVEKVIVQTQNLVSKK